MANPLLKLTKKDIPWQWGQYQRKAFQDLKDVLCTAPIVQFPDPKLPYIVVTYALHIAVGGVLMQDHGESLKSLTFLSRQFDTLPRVPSLCAITRKNKAACEVP